MSNKIKWDGWMFPKSMYEKIIEFLPEGSTILEFGSGRGSILLLEKYNLISIEHSEKWAIQVEISKYNHIMIHAPIVDCKTKGFSYSNKWYDFKVILKSLKGLKWDMVLIDGPTGKYGRAGILNYKNKIDLTVPIVMDDLQKGSYLGIFKSLIGDRKWYFNENNKNRMFGIIWSKDGII